MLKWIFPRTKAAAAIRDFPVRETSPSEKVFPPAVPLFSLYLTLSPFFSLSHFIIGLSSPRFVDDLVVLKRASSYGSRRSEGYMGRSGENE